MTKMVASPSTSPERRSVNIDCSERRWPGSSSRPSRMIKVSLPLLISRLKVLGHGHVFEVWILISSGSDIIIQIRTRGFGVI